MKFGLCCSPQQLGFEQGELVDNIRRLQTAGADYLEFTVAATHPEGNPDDWEAVCGAFENAPLRVEAFNSFIPAHHRITGPNVQLAGVLDYCSVALKRCRALGAQVVVLGSAGARKAPEEFDKQQAEKQFVEFCRELAPIAQDANITVCIEPLNHKEDNLILSVEHGARIVDEVAHPSIQLLADLYHIEIEGEPLENVAAAGSRLRHAHLADKGRVAPGFATEGEADFRGFFAALASAGYTESTPGRCSFEGTYENIFAQAQPLIDFLEQRSQPASAN